MARRAAGIMMMSALAEPLDVVVEDRRRIATHEAGHGVAAVALKVPCAAIMIVTGSPEAAGLYLPTFDGNLPAVLAGLRERGPARRADYPDANVMPRIVAALSGGAAVMHAFGPHVSRGDFDDHRRALQLVSDILRKPETSIRVHQFVEAARLGARRLVRQHWPWIVATADALSTAGTLTGAQIRALRPTRAQGDPC